MLEKIEIDPERYSQKTPSLGGEPVSGTYLEITYDPDTAKTGFAVWKDGSVEYVIRFPVGGNRFWIPFSPTNNLIAHQVVLLPSKADEFGSEADLISEIREFIHRYVDISPIFEKIATYYVLFSWIYDDFNELPYLRLRGDFGTGKTRFLLIVGSICYRPIFASGASTISPLFRLLDSFRGTLIIDEGDFRFSDEKAEIVKILNNGNARGFPVLRSEVTGNKKEFNPTAFDVFGPKIVATRGFFDDRALESRFITEEMGQRRLRTDIPINLPFNYKVEALQLRNKLLLFRFRNRGSRQADPALIDRAIEPRLNQIFVPILSVMKDEETRKEVQALAREYSREMIDDRAMDVEANILEVMQHLLSSPGEGLSIKEITSRFAERHSDDFERKITPHWIGQIIRRKLHLRTERHSQGYEIPISEKPKLERLLEIYGIAAGPLMNSVNSMNSEKVNDGTK
jgi:hypothetical protein